MTKDISLDSSSFSLIRTNPVLTGNIKLTIDSGGGLYLDSMDSNRELSKDIYKRHAVSLSLSHPANIKRFLNNGNVSPDILYDVYRSVDPTKNSSDFKDQYDFSLYWSGVRYLSSKQYDEKMSCLAPLYLNGKDIPSKFVVFKVDGPMNHNISEMKDKYPYSNMSEYMRDVLSSSTIIKTFDLGVSTKVGKYIRNMVSDVMYPQTALDVNFGEGQLTYWRGVDFRNGVYADLGEMLYDFYKKPNLIKTFDDYITNGFKRHGLIYPHILNLEFLFDDDTSEVFDHNRYIGFYVNDSEGLLLSVDTEAMRLNSTYELIGNTPIIYNKIDANLNVDTNIYNVGGVRLAVSEPPISLGDYNSSDTSQFVSCVVDKHGNNHSISYGSSGIGNAGVNLDYVNIKLTDKKINLLDFMGRTDGVLLTGSGVVATTRNKSSLSFAIKDTFTSGDELVIYHDGGSNINVEGSRYDTITFFDGFGMDKMYGHVGDYYADVRNLDMTVPVYSLPSRMCGYWNGINDMFVSGSEIQDFVLSDYMRVNDYFIVKDVVDVVDPIDECIISGSSGFLFFKNRYELSMYAKDKILVGYGSGGVDISSVYSVDSWINDTFVSDEEDLIIVDKLRYLLVYDRHNSIGYSVNGDVVDNTSGYSDGPCYLIKYDNRNVIIGSSSLSNGDVVKRSGVYSVFYGGVRTYVDAYLVNVDISDYSNKYYVGITTPTDYTLIYDAIVSCINEIPMRGFRAFTDGSAISLVNEEFGDHDGSFRCDFVPVSGLDSTIDFIDGIGYAYGGSDYANVLLVDYDNYDFLKSNSDGVLVRIGNGYSSVSKVCRFSGYISRDVDRAGLSSAFTYHNKYVAIVISKQGIPLVKNGKFEIVGDFKPKLCKLSFYNIRDFDFDYYSDRYSRVSGIDIIENFNVPSGSGGIKRDHVYLVLGTGSIMYAGEEVVAVGSLPQSSTVKGFIVYTIGVIDYTVVSGSPVVIPWFRLVDKDHLRSGVYNGISISSIVSADVGDITWSLYGVTCYTSHIENDTSRYELTLCPVHDEDGGLSDFDGFFTLRDNYIPYSGDVNSVEYKFRDKFTHNAIRTEYDYNRENYIPDLSTFNKLVSHSCKWGYVNGLDSRDNPYRLNTSFVFGADNISPSHFVEGVSAASLTHEFLYVATSVDFNELSDFNYIKIRGLDYTSDNWFDNTFVIYEGGVAKRKFSTIKYNYTTGICETFFKGVRLLFKTPSNSYFDTYSGSKKSFVVNDNKYEGYKFSAILVSEEEFYDKLNISEEPFVQAPFRVKFVVDDVQKFILLVVSVKLGICNAVVDKLLIVHNNVNDITLYNVTTNSGSSGILSYDDIISGGNYNYSQLYPSYDLNGNVVGNVTYPTVSVYGDYKLIGNIGINSDDVRDDYVSVNLTTSMLYNMKHKKFSPASKCFSTTNVPTFVNNIGFKSRYTNSSIVCDITKDANGLYDGVDLGSYYHDLSSDISNFNADAILICKQKDNRYSYYDNIGLHSGYYNGDWVINMYNPLVGSTNGALFFNSGSNGRFFAKSIVTGKSRLAGDIGYMQQLFGGKDYYTKLLSRVSFASLKEMLNSYSGSVEYVKPDETSVETLFVEVDVISVVDKTGYILNDNINIESNVVGFDPMVASIKSPVSLFRYSGGYVPIFNDIMTFGSDIEKGFYNSTFVSASSSFAVVKNNSHLKVSNLDIFKLSRNNKYNLVYDLIGESTIGHADLNVMLASWDYGFHRLYTTSTTSVPVAGTLRIEEDDAFFNNIITLPDSVTIGDFGTPLKVADISVVDMSSQIIVYSISGNTVRGMINIKNKFHEILVGLGFGKSFDDYVFVGDDPTEYTGGLSTSDYLREYINANILKLYSVSSVDMLVSPNTSGGGVVGAVTSSYVIDKDVRINNNDKDIITFSYDMRANSNINIGFSVKMKLT